MLRKKKTEENEMDVLNSMDKMEMLHGTGDLCPGMSNIIQFQKFFKFLEEEKKQKLDKNKQEKKQVADCIYKLSKEIKYSREELVKALSSDKQLLQDILKNHRRFQLAFRELQPEKVIEDMEHYIHRKHRELDRLLYKKKKLTEKIKELKIEAAELEDVNSAASAYTHQYTEGALLKEIDNIDLKHDISMKTNRTYKKIISIYKEESQHFTTMLDNLEADSAAQSKYIIHAAKMGQDANKQLVHLHLDYKNLEQQIKENMRQRDEQLFNLKSEIRELYLQSLALVHTKKDATVETESSLTSFEEELGMEHRALEDILNDIQNIMNVTSYEDIFPRMKNQLNQANILTSQMELNTSLTEHILNTKNHAEVVLVKLQSAMFDSTAQFKQEESRILSDIALEEQCMKNTKSELEQHCNFLATLRCALQPLYEMVSRINVLEPESREHSKDTLSTEKHVSLSPTENFPEAPDVTPMPKSVQDILDIVTSKITFLISLVPKEPDDHTLQQAKQQYQQKIKAELSRAQVADLLKYERPLVDFDELRKIDDEGVLTREDVKKRSENIVNTYLRLAKQDIFSPAGLMSSPSQFI